jgi:hypothetical protein
MRDTVSIVSPQVIGDILARHRKLDFVASWDAVGHFK